MSFFDLLQPDDSKTLDKQSTANSTTTDQEWSTMPTASFGHKLND